MNQPLENGLFPLPRGLAPFSSSKQRASGSLLAIATAALVPARPAPTTRTSVSSSHVKSAAEDASIPDAFLEESHPASPMPVNPAMRRVVPAAFIKDRRLCVSMLGSLTLRPYRLHGMSSFVTMQWVDSGPRSAVGKLPLLGIFWEKGSWLLSQKWASLFLEQEKR